MRDLMRILFVCFLSASVIACDDDSSTDDNDAGTDVTVDGSGDNQGSGDGDGSGTSDGSGGTDVDAGTVDATVPDVNSDDAAPVVTFCESDDDCCRG